MALTLGSIGLSGCAAQHTPPGVIAVVGAEAQYGDLLSQIGGRYVQVTSFMTSPSTDPHNFEASPSVARTISSAQLIVQNGAGYDVFMNKLESATSNPSRVVLVVAALLDERSAANPHFWYAPTTMPLVAEHVANSLEKIAPRHAEYFRAKLAEFVSSWRPVTSAIQTARRDFAGQPVASTEPVGDYLFTAMGLSNLTPFRFQADVMNGIDPAPEDIVIQQDLIVHHRVAALAYNAQVSSPVTQALSNLALQDHVATVPIDEILPAHLHVQSWMLSTIAALEEPLKMGGGA